MNTKGPSNIRGLVLLVVLTVLSVSIQKAWARTDLFFVAPVTVAPVPGTEFEITVYAKAERLRAFGFELLLDTRYVTYVDNSISKTDLSHGFDFLGANLLEDRVYDETRPYLKELVIGGSVLEPVSTYWSHDGEEHGIRALATFRLRLTDDFVLPPGGFLLLPIAKEKTVNDFVGFRQGGGIVLFNAQGVALNVTIHEPVNEARYEDANITLSGNGTREGEPLDLLAWLDPTKIVDPVGDDFLVHIGGEGRLDLSASSPGIHVLYLAGMDQDLNATADFTVFGVGEDVVVRFFGSIEGQVRSATLLEPIGGAEVVLYEGAGEDLRRVSSVSCDATGGFRIEGISAGTYTVIARKEGFQEGSQVVQLQSDNDTVTGVVIELLPLGRPTGDVYTYVTGTFCVEYSGDDLSKSGVTIRDMSGFYRCTTGEDGCCRIPWLRKGEQFKYMWLAEGEGIYSKVTGPQPVTENEHQKIEIIEARLSQLRVVVKDPYTLAGVEGVAVSLGIPEGGESMEKTTPFSGEVLFSGLDPGLKYELNATGTDLKGNTHFVSQEVELHQGMTSTYTIYLHMFDPGGIGPEQDGLGDLSLQILDGDTLRPITVSTDTAYLLDQDGVKTGLRFNRDHYEAQGLFSGNYTLWLTPPGYLPLEGKVISIDPGKITTVTASLYRSRSASLTVNTLDKKGDAEVAGVVLDLDTLAPVWNAQVRLLKNNTNETSLMRTDSQGRFLKGALPPGIYQIEVTSEGYQGVRMQLDLQPGERSSGEIYLTRQEQGSVSSENGAGREGVLYGVCLSSVLDFSPVPVSGAHLLGIDPSTHKTIFEKTTDGQGNFAIRGVSEDSPFILKISAPGFEDQSLGPFQLTSNTVEFFPIFMLPYGIKIRISGGPEVFTRDTLRFVPTEERLLLLRDSYLDLYSLDPARKESRFLWTTNLATAPQWLDVFFGMDDTGESHYSIYLFDRNKVLYSSLRGLGGMDASLEREFTIPSSPYCTAYRYPNYFVGTGSGLLSYLTYGDVTTGTTPFSENSTISSPTLIYTLTTITPRFIFPVDQGIIAVDGEGKATFVDLTSPLIPYLKDTWAVGLRPVDGKIAGGAGIFVDSEGMMVPVKSGVDQGTYIPGVPRPYMHTKGCRVFSIPHPEQGFEGKKMSFAICLGDNYLDVVELTDLNPFLLRRYPLRGEEAFFTGDVWVEYASGQDHFEGGVYVGGDQGIYAIPMPRYLGDSQGELSVRIGPGEIKGAGGLFTDKGTVWPVEDASNGTTVNLALPAGVYDLYLKDSEGSVFTETGTSVTGHSTVSVGTALEISIETLRYPDQVTRAFSPGDDFGLSITMNSGRPRVADLYLLTDVRSGNSTFEIYWTSDEDDHLAPLVLDTASGQSPVPVAQGVYINGAINTSIYLLRLPQGVEGLSGDVKLVAVESGASINDNGKVLGEDVVTFRVQ